MTLALPAWQILALAALVLGLALATGAAVRLLIRRRGGTDTADGAAPDSRKPTADADATAEYTDPVPDGGTVVDGHLGSPHVLALDPPTLQSARFGTFSEIYRLYKQHRRRQRLADEGYIQWFLVGDRWPTPRYVKPSDAGGGVPEYEYDGQTYLFPSDARIPSEQQGLWTVVHSRGDAVPLKPQEPTEVPIPADVLSEYLDMSVTSSPPGLLEGLDLDAEDLVKYSIGALVLYVILQEVLGGLPL
jgi:hypothetical protein